MKIKVFTAGLSEFNIDSAGNLWKLNQNCAILKLVWKKRNNKKIKSKANRKMIDII